MKKTLVLYRDYQEMRRWLDERGVRSHRANGLYRTKVDGKFYILQNCFHDGFGSNLRAALRKETLVDVTWLGDPSTYRTQELLRDVQSIVKCKYRPDEKLPERDMSLGGMVQFHSVPVHVCLVGETLADPHKAWYIFRTKTWVVAGTNTPIAVAEWYVDWFIPEGA